MFISWFWSNSLCRFFLLNVWCLFKGVIVSMCGMLICLLFHIKCIVCYSIYTYYGCPLTKGLILLAKNNIVIVKFQSKVGWNLVGVAHSIENLQSIGMSWIVEINQPSSLDRYGVASNTIKLIPIFGQKMDSYWIIYLKKMNSC